VHVELSKIATGIGDEIEASITVWHDCPTAD
jgi:hypothetical protein